MHFSATDTEPATQLAFLDARRLARIRLAREPLKEPPISELGFDPILSMPKLEEFKKMVLKRTCVVKALLLDQGFSAGVGNWVAGAFILPLFVLGTYASSLGLKMRYYISQRSIQSSERII